MKRWHLTKAEKAKIKKLTLRRTPQAEIAKIMGITAPSVSKAQRAMNLPTVPPVPEKKILQLLRAGMGQHRIHKLLNVSQPKVHAVMVKHGIRNGNAPTPEANLARFVEALKKREHHINNLAKKYRIGVCKAYRLAHEVLACPEFRPGAAWPPLSSNFPQRHFDRKLAEPDKFVEIVQRVCAMCFAGKLPATDDATFVAAMMAGLAQTVLAGQPQVVLDRFAMGLTVAVDCLRREKTDWKN